MNAFKVSFSGVFILFAVLSAGSLFAQQSGLAVNGDQGAKDIYLAASTVQVSADVAGDAVVAGGSISIANSVAGDVLAAGGTVNITANVGDDIRAAGGSITIAGDVGDDLVVAGGAIVLDSASTVSGRAWLAGGTVTVAGNVNHELRATGENIILAGAIGGDAHIYAKSIEIKPGAVIKGNLTYSSPSEAEIHQDAVIEGDVNHNEIESDDFDDPGADFIGNLMFYISLAASALALFLAFPLRSISVVKQLQDAPLQSSGLGVLVLFATPLIALMLLVSVIGAPIALVALALYVIALILGLLVGVIWIGDIGFRQFGKEPDESKRTRAWSIAAAAAVLLIVDWIPFVGGLVFFIVLVLGIGGVIQFLYRLYIDRDGNPGAISKAAQ